MGAVGAIYVVLVVFIQETFGSVTKDLGFLAVGLVCGLLAGAIGYGKWGHRFKWYKVIFFCLILAGGTLTLMTWVMKVLVIY